MSDIGDLLTLFRLLCDYGMDQLEANVYGTLLAHGPTPHVRLAGLIGVPPEAIAPHLVALSSTSRMLVGSDDRKGVLHYYACEPSAAWHAIAAGLRWEQSFDMDEDMTTSSNPRTQMFQEIARIACIIYHPHATSNSHRERDIDSSDELARRTCDIISMANREILAASRSPRLPQVASFWMVITKRLSEGVRYQRVADLEELIDHGLAVVRRDIEVAGVELFVLESQRIGSKFYTVDARWLSVYHSGAIPDARGVGRVTSQRAIILRYTKRFDAYRRDAMSGGFVLAKLREISEVLLERATKCLEAEEVEWVASLIEGGKFSTFARERGWSGDRLRTTIERAARARIIRLNGEGVAVPDYPIDEATLRSAFRAAPHGV